MGVFRPPYIPSEGCFANSSFWQNTRQIRSRAAVGTTGQPGPGGRHGRRSSNSQNYDQDQAKRLDGVGARSGSPRIMCETTAGRNSPDLLRKPDRTDA
jgi:hypothetical protein